MQVDYIIIGQGLAGSLLAWELIQRQQKVIIVDNAKENASLIAAGLINPVTGMRFVKAKEIDWLLPSAVDYYQHLATHFNQTFYIKKPMLRLLSNAEEQTAVNKRFKQSEYQGFLTLGKNSRPSIMAHFGIVEQQHTGYLLTQPLLSALKNYFISIKAYIKAELDYKDITLTNIPYWQNIKAKKIIFCEGYKATINPWYSWLPFQLVKGEIITLHSSQPIEQNMLNYGQWYIPLNTYQYRIGATFDRENLNTNITQQAKKLLLKKINQVYPTLETHNIIQQQAGIRPTTRDKQPFIGHHPKHSKLLIFNGFGAKGSLQIPWHCQRLVDHLLQQSALPLSCDIKRYYPYFN